MTCVDCLNITRKLLAKVESKLSGLQRSLKSQGLEDETGTAAIILRQRIKQSPMVYRHTAIQLIGISETLRMCLEITDFNYPGHGFRLSKNEEELATYRNHIISFSDEPGEFANEVIRDFGRCMALRHSAFPQFLEHIGHLKRFVWLLQRAEELLNQELERTQGRTSAQK